MTRCCDGCVVRLGKIELEMKLLERVQIIRGKRKPRKTIKEMIKKDLQINDLDTK